jgi:restriction system protein
MALWLIRTGRHGELEQVFLRENRIYLTWGGLKHDLGPLKEKSDLRKLLQTVYPTAPKGRISNNTGQIWAFAKKINPGDWVIVPYKTKPAVNIAEVTGPYVFDGTARDPMFHYRTVKWIATDIPRSVFDQDLLFSFGAIMTICQIERNDAEKRVRAMAASGWQPAAAVKSTVEATDDAESNEGIDLELLARDQIAKHVIRRFKGHGLARLVEAILRAQDYTTFLSPEGPDKGIDILAAPGPLGFGKPRICVQVKSGDSPVDSPTLNQLIGAMQNVQADQGLLVSWGGFKSSVDKEVPTQFFRVRLWDQETLISEFLHVYDKLDAELRAEIPVKRIWSLAAQEEEEE